MFQDQAAYSNSQQLAATSTGKQMGIHERSGTILNRLNTVNTQLEMLVTRVSGPRPSAMPDQVAMKSPVEPSLVDFCGSIQRELDRLESYVRDITSTIG